MSKHNTIVFYAPTGYNTPGHKIGGAEAGCRKTLQILRGAGYNVILVEKPIKSSFSFFVNIRFVFTLGVVWARLVFLFFRYRKSYFHLAGFYLDQVYAEAVFAVSARLLGIKTVYEIRNGGMIEAYFKRGKLYRYLMRSIFKNASKILCQGKSYVPFVQKISHSETIYYPNYILDCDIPSFNDSRNDNTLLQLVYLGRIVPDKNIDFILDIVYVLKQRQILFHLTLIGAYSNEYYQLLHAIIDKYDLASQISFTGRLEGSAIFERLMRQHFFLFPTKEKREGHSNALTETMAYGIVPVASANGFNRDIIGNDNLIVDQFQCNLYAEKIESIWKSQEWEKYSQDMRARVLNNFTESHIERSLLAVYSF